MVWYIDPFEAIIFAILILVAFSAGAAVLFMWLKDAIGKW